MTISNEEAMYFGELLWELSEPREEWSCMSMAARQTWADRAVALRQAQYEPWRELIPALKAATERIGAPGSPFDGICRLAYELGARAPK